MFEYTLSFVPYKFYVFGCGGTGSRLVPLAAQFIKSCRWLEPFSPEMILIDPDVVEEKNLSRQNFIKRDLDKGKAVVLAERYSKGFGLPIKAFFGKVNRGMDAAAREDFDNLSEHPAEVDLFRNPFSNSVIFLCVDSISARKEILEYIFSFRVSDTPNLLIIDTGNENDFGQVKLVGSHLPYRELLNVENILPDNVPVKLPINYMPMDSDYFYNMQPPAETLSCADLDQTMAINCLVANTAFSVLQNILYRNTLPVHRYNISLLHGIQPEYLTWKYIRSLKYGHLGVGFGGSNKPILRDLVYKMKEEFPALLKQPVE